MKRVLRWVGMAVAALALLAVVAALVVYAWSESMLRRHSPVRAASVTVPTDAASIAEGRRLSLVHGCVGCHGAGVAGNELLDEPAIATIVAPNLTTIIRTYGDADLVTAIRHGVRADGRTMIVMPSQAFVPLSDADMGRLVGYLRSLPPVPGPGARAEIGPIGRIGLVLAKYKTSLQLVEDASDPPEATPGSATLGRYLARTSCAQCHGADLRGASHPEGVAPDLRIVAAYSTENFATLMRTGMGIGGRKLGVMTPWAASYFPSFTAEEVDGLYAYLHTLPPAVSK